MKSPYRIVALLLLSLSVNNAHAYNKNQGSSSCEKPIFSEYQPAGNKYTQSFGSFSFIASSNTAPGSITVNVSAGENKFHFDAKALEIVQEKSGKFKVNGKLLRPIEHGFARVSITAHSKPGCEHTDGYLIRIH